MKCRILVVDDTKTLRELITAWLLPEYDVETAVGASDAVAALHVAAAKRSSPDLILVDNCMPHMSGVELVRILRSRPEWRQRPIVGFTASDDASEMIRAGCCDTAPKTIRPKALRALLAATLERCGQAVGCAYCCTTTTTPIPVHPPDDGQDPAGG